MLDVIIILLSSFNLVDLTNFLQHLLFCMDNFYIHLLFIAYYCCLDCQRNLINTFVIYLQCHFESNFSYYGTGDCSSKFCVLEDHLVYSLNDEKTTTMLYIMKSLDTVNGALVGFSIKDVLSGSVTIITMKVYI